MNTRRKTQLNKRSAILIDSLIFVIMISLAACTSAKPQPSPEIFSLAGPRLLFLNRSANYKITVLNTKKEPEKEGEVTARLSKEFAYISSTPKGVFTPAKEDSLASVAWRLGEIAPGDNVEIELELRAAATGRARIDSKLFFSEGEPLMAIVETQITGIPAIHISSYDTEDPVEVGKQTIYVIEARNEGTSPCTNVAIESKIPKEMEFVAAEGPTGFKHKSGLTRFETVPILQPGEKLTYKVVSKCIKAGSAKHTAILAFDQFKQPIMDEEGTSCYE
ncbi:MAG: hypothetical protein ABII75_02195 [Candidatus Omnitrophota bacterium]